MSRVIRVSDLFGPVNLGWKETILWDRRQAQGRKGAGTVKDESESIADRDGEIKVEFVSGLNEPNRCISELRVT